MKKILKHILYKAGILEVIGSTEIVVESICFDSRKVKQGALFVAICGTQSDGHNFITQVLNSGAVAIVCEKLPDKILTHVTYVRVNNSSIALAHIASNYYDDPSSKLKLVGITGTNGKTTIATLLFQLFRQLGYKTCLLSTVKNQVNEDVIPSTHTTPDALELNALLAHATDEGCTHCFMEVSSHAIIQNRIVGLNFTGAVFTNITHEHLDYHGTFDEYIKAKKRFFDVLSDEAFALVNADDRNAGRMLQNTKAITKTYSLQSLSDFKARVLENVFSGLFLNIDGKEVSCKLIGTFNAYNLLAIYATGILLGEDKEAILSILSNLTPVEGRFEYVLSSNHITGIVDYAHTPDALKNVLKTINDLRTRNEKLITIIGCGGNRDASKRPMMAEIACELSDKVVLTSDNPRMEDPLDILEQMKKGVPGIHFKKTLTIADRREAIKTAYALANPGDIILLAGKGHEKYQEIKGIQYPFDDKEILSETFKEYEK